MEISSGLRKDKVSHKPEAYEQISLFLEKLATLHLLFSRALPPQWATYVVSLRVCVSVLHLFVCPWIPPHPTWFLQQHSSLWDQWQISHDEWLGLVVSLMSCSHIPTSIQCPSFELVFFPKKRTILLQVVDCFRTSHTRLLQLPATPPPHPPARRTAAKLPFGKMVISLWTKRDACASKQAWCSQMFQDVSIFLLQTRKPSNKPAYL